MEDLYLDLLNLITSNVCSHTVCSWIQRGLESSEHASSCVESSTLQGKSKTQAVRLTYSAMPEVCQIAGQ